MTIEFYAAESQHVVGPVVMLPQKGSDSGGSHRPLNSFAVLREGYAILFDAPYSWTLDGVRGLVADGHAPRALVLSHSNTAGSGDAFDADVFDGVPVFLHPEDQAVEESRETGIDFQDPVPSAILTDAKIQVIHVPGHTPGSIMLYLPDAGGILLTGDCAVGPGPEQSDCSPRLQRTMDLDGEAAFKDAWRKIADRLPLAAVLPLHGECYLRAEQETFNAIVANIWNGDPMDPTKT